MTQKLDRSDVKYAEFSSYGAVVVWATGSEKLDYSNPDELELAQHALNLMGTKLKAAAPPLVVVL